VGSAAFFLWLPLGPGARTRPRTDLPYTLPVPTPDQIPPSHALGLTAAQFAREYRHLKGEKVDLYRRIFRDGELNQPGLNAAVAPIVREQREANAEGEVIKFVQALGGTALRAVSSETADAGSQSRPTTRLETESVLIPMIGRGGQTNYTLCVSSQVGCAMGCGFCETAQMGLIRDLTPAEIVGQWFAATHLIGIRPRNMVFMGMGEPMDNLENVIQAIAVLIDDNGPAMAVSKITVSTVGRVDGIRRLAEQVRKPGWHRLGLAISINAPSDAVRSELMPVNRKYPMAELRSALEAWPKYGGGKFCIEYVLIPGVNDRDEHARELADYVRGLPACVNLIPYNPRRNSPWPAPTEESVTRFMSLLAAAGAYVKRRRTKGRDLMGACGQLGNPQIRRRRYVGVSVAAVADE
jgi:23S rRNA (adenine2503-C2)-methyltransferase